MSRPARLPSAFTLFDRLLTLSERLAALFRSRRDTAPARARLALEGMEDRLVPSLTLSLTLSPTSTGIGSPVQVTGSVTAGQPMMDVSVTYEWDDGTSSSQNYDESASPTTVVDLASPTHTYAAAGSYEVITMVDVEYAASGGWDFASGGATETVASGGVSPPPPPPPVVTISPPTQSIADGGSANVVVSRSGGNTSQPLSVDLSLGSDGSDPLAAWDTNYSISGSGASFYGSGGTVTFGAG